jgi:tRNA(Ile)-lysidine synthase
MRSRWCRIRPVDVRRHRDRLYLVPKLPELAGLRDPDDEGIIVKHAQASAGSGEASMAFPDYGGVLHFDAAADMASIRPGCGAGHWKSTSARAANGSSWRRTGPTRGLKQLFQAADVPVWERPRLPIVSSGFELLFAAGLGMDCRFGAEGEGRIALRWEAA